jgi:hypothetical protein
VPRLVRVFEPTWQDRYFRKTVAKLALPEREERAQQVADLVKTLQICAHPVTDPRLQPWRPSAYRGVAQIQGGYLVEYRFPGVMRVIACCFEGSVESTLQGLVLLLTITLDHDHERMKRLIRQSSREIAEKGEVFLEEGPEGFLDP